MAPRWRVDEYHAVIGMRLEILVGRPVDFHVIRRRLVITVERIATAKRDRRYGVDIRAKHLVGACDEVSAVGRHDTPEGLHRARLRQLLYSDRLVIPSVARNRHPPGRGAAPLPGRLRFLAPLGMTASARNDPRLSVPERRSVSFRTPPRPHFPRYVMRRPPFAVWIRRRSAGCAARAARSRRARRRSTTRESGASAPADLSAAKPGRDPNQPIDAAYTEKIQEYTTETFFLSPLVDYLPAAQGRADAQGRVRRHRRRAEQAAVLEGGLRLHAPAREGEPAREGLLDRHDGRRPRDDRRRRRVRGAAARSSTRTRPSSRSSPTRARSTWTTRWPSRSRPTRRRSTTSPARSTRRKPARRRR